MGKPKTTRKKSSGKKHTRRLARGGMASFIRRIIRPCCTGRRRRTRRNIYHTEDDYSDINISDVGTHSPMGDDGYVNSYALHLQLEAERQEAARQEAARQEALNRLNNTWIPKEKDGGIIHKTGIKKKRKSNKKKRKSRRN